MRATLQGSGFRIVTSSDSRKVRAMLRALPTPTPGIVIAAALLQFTSCTKTSEVSKQKARVEVETLAKAAQVDVDEVRKGLPPGRENKLLKRLLCRRESARRCSSRQRSARDRAQPRTRDLRTAKSTFFLVADKTGLILRSDLEHDALATKNLFSAFDLKAATTGKYVEARGSMPGGRLRMCRGRGDGQWTAATPVMKGSEVAGVYATGWSWSAVRVPAREPAARHRQILEATRRARRCRSSTCT